MKIVVEGPNGSGKSTLVSALSEALSINVFHPGPSPLNDSVAVENCMQQLCMDHILHDRVTCFSTLCYERPDSLSTGHYNVLMWYCREMSRESILILCTGAGEYTCKSYYPTSHFDTIRREQDEIRNRYMILFRRFSHFKFDFNKNSLREVIDYVKQSKKYEDC